MSHEKKSQMIWEIIIIVVIVFFVKNLFGWFQDHEKETVTKEVVVEVEQFQRISEEEMLQTLQSVQIGDVIYFGVSDNIYVDWKVLDKEEGKILVISNSLLTVRKFHESQADENNRYLTITWADSDIRTWLNSELYDSLFDDFEKNRILDTNVTTPPGRMVNFTTGLARSGGEDTIDKLFLLSFDEVNQYFPSGDSMKPSNEVYLLYDNSSGYMELSDIVRVNPGQSYSVKKGVPFKLMQAWWLRSPGEMTFYMGSVGNVESQYQIDESGYNVLEYLGVRPAMWISTVN